MVLQIPGIPNFLFKQSRRDEDGIGQTTTKTKDFFLSPGSFGSLTNVTHAKDSAADMDSLKYPDATDGYGYVSGVCPSNLQDKTFSIDLYFLPSVNAGSVVIWFYWRALKDGGGTATQQKSAEIDMTGSQNKLKIVNFTTDGVMMAGKAFGFVIEREGTAAGDTMAGNLYLLGVRVNYN